PRRARRRRLILRIAIPVVVLSLFAILFPRGYVVGVLTFSCGCGATATASRTQLVGPSWLPVAYPHWTSMPKDVSKDHAHAWLFTVTATKTWITWDLGTRTGGGLS